jgi:hypothetical protein
MKKFRIKAYIYVYIIILDYEKQWDPYTYKY